VTINRSRVREALKAFDFDRLFIEELGWDRHRLRPVTATVDGSTYQLHAIAEKRGMVAFLCDALDAAPDYAVRRKIENQARRAAHEHLIIYIDRARQTQIWQWVRREPGRPAACREHSYQAGQPGEALVQKLEGISFSLDEEEALGIASVALGARRAFDVERVTKRFYDRFQSEHGTFIAFIQGIQAQGDREWYGSLMLNRLMFIYFIQKKGFLDGDTDYLRNRMRQMRARKGKDKFHSFYRHFLLRLFHDGLGQDARTSELDALLGRVPYLNGGLFDVHDLERGNASIAIADEAFEKIFDFFDAYQWHLDARPLRSDNEINPDVLGYIFEKYINQKQMGAYYTKEDITEYISKNTVVPFLLDATRAECRVAFENPEGPTVWDLLKADPDRYIYPSVRHGNQLPLPGEIAAGLDPSTLHEPVSSKSRQTLQRMDWNKSAPSEYALPTETWREVVARRTRHEEVRAKLASGEVHEIDELITLNLDVRQFAQDAIENCEGSELLRAFWQTIGKVTILDPTCGSGAFLFAALNILEPLYEACLDRMEVFIEDLDRAGDRIRPEQFSDFREILSLVAAHPNRRYFICKSIILNNLFGVDIMEEAVEICKLRLFLKLAAQVEPDANHGNLGIEPLPDIDFNIKAGNTLVGFATFDEAKRTITSKLDYDNAMEKIAVRAVDLQKAFDVFREHQIGGDGAVPKEHKLAVRTQLSGLQDELNRYLAPDSGVKLNDKAAFAKWLKSYQPFHWFVEFYGIMAAGGFDVIIGNPPYLDLRQLTQYRPEGYVTLPTKNLCSLVLERCDALTNGRQGYIVPIATTATEGYRELQQILTKRDMWFVSFDDRPAHLFDGLDKNTLSIVLLSQPRGETVLASSRLNRWNSEERPSLFQQIRLYPTPSCRLPGCLPRIGGDVESRIWQKVFGKSVTMASAYSGGGNARTYYSRKVNAFLQSLDFVPRVLDGRGVLRPPSEFKTLTFADAADAASVFCLLNSSLFRWFIDAVSDGSHLNRREIANFPFDPRQVADRGVLESLAERLSKDLKKNSFERTMTYRHDTLTVQCIVPKHSKSIIDAIDHVLARHFGFTEEELDFIINYDIKYRLGAVEDNPAG